MAEDLLSYHGDAGLGLGSTPGIPAISEKDNLNVINQTSRDLMLLDNERNMKMFAQKVKDRDTLSEMIIGDKVATGNILPEYMPQFEGARKDVEKAFYDWKGNQNDLKGLSNYKDKVQHLKDVAAHAQVNTTELGKLQQQMAGEKLPKKKAEIGKYIEDQKGQNFWNPINPYQQLHDLDMGTFQKFVEPVTGIETPDKAKPWQTVDVSKVDYADIRRKALSGYINDLDQQNDIDQLMTKFQNYNQQGLTQALTAMNGQLDKYNKDNGLAQGDPGYVDAIKTVKDEKTGQVAIAEPQVDFAAKYALANQAKFKTVTPKFSKDLANYDIGLKKLDLQARKLGIDRDKAGAYIRNLDAKTSKFNESEDNRTNVIKQYDMMIDHIKSGDIVHTNPATKRVTGYEDAVYLDELPESFKLINGPVMATAITTKKDGTTTVIPTGKITVGELRPFTTTDKSHRPYYIPTYALGATGRGVKLSDDTELRQKYKETAKKVPGLTYERYIQGLLKSGGIETSWTGLNSDGKIATANFTSMMQSAKVINAQLAKKGQENVINPPGSVTEAQEEVQDPGE